MAKAKQSAVKEIFDDENAGYLDYLQAWTLAYSVTGEMDNLKRLVGEWQEQAKTTRSDAAKLRASLCAGIGLWIMRRYAEAAEILANAADHAEGGYFRGLSLMEIGSYEEAINALKQAGKAGQDKFTCAMAIADALRRSGEVSKALKQIEKHEEDNDGEAELHYQKGRCLEDDDQLDAAMDAYERAVELNPQHAGALFRLGYWNDLHGNDDAAIDYYEKAAEITPLRSNVLLNLGMLYEDHGKYDKAQRTYEMVSEAERQNRRARMYAKDAGASLDMYYDETIERRQHRTAQLLLTPLSDFELSARSRTCLEKMNIRSLGDLARLTEEELSQSKNFGETSMSELRRLLQSKGLHFGYGRSEGEQAPEALAAPRQAGVLAKPITELDLSIRSYKCMRTLGIETVGDLVERTEKDLLQCANFGQTSLEEIREKLDELDLSLKPAS